MKKIFYLLAICLLSSCVQFTSNGDWNSSPNTQTIKENQKTLKVFYSLSSLDHSTGTYKEVLNNNKKPSINITTALKKMGVPFVMTDEKSNADVVIDAKMTHTTETVTQVTAILSALTFFILPMYGEEDLEVVVKNKNGKTYTSKESITTVAGVSVLPFMIIFHPKLIHRNMIQEGVDKTL